jgi:hypothetical protein
VTAKSIQTGIPGNNRQGRGLVSRASSSALISAVRLNCTQARFVHFDNERLMLKILNRILWLVQAIAVSIPPMDIPGFRRRSRAVRR